MYGTSEAEIFRKSIFFYVQTVVQIWVQSDGIQFFFMNSRTRARNGVEKGVNRQKLDVREVFFHSARPKEENEPN